MKKIKLISFLVIGTILTACTNETMLNTVQHNDGQPIGFESYTEKATRGDATVNTNLEYYHNTFAVYGTKQSIDDNTDIQYVFGGKALEPGVQNGETCAYQTTADAVLGDWKYTEPRYWDKRANYRFIAYAPVSAANPIRYFYGDTLAQVKDSLNEFRTTASYILTGTNLQDSATTAEIVRGFNVERGADLDLMVSSANSQSGAAHDAYVNLSFRHILSKFNVTFSKAESLQNAKVSITSLNITGFKDLGDYTESTFDSNSDPRVSGWTASLSANAAAYVLTFSKPDSLVLNDGTYENSVFVKGAPFYVIESLLIPQDIAPGQVTITANYTIERGLHKESFPYALDLYDVVNLRRFYDGYNYTLNFTINPDIIKFDATTSTWANQTAVERTNGGI